MRGDGEAGCKTVFAGWKKSIAGSMDAGHVAKMVANRPLALGRLGEPPNGLSGFNAIFRYLRYNYRDQIERFIMSIRKAVNNRTSQCGVHAIV